MLMANREMELALMTVGMTTVLRNALYAGMMPVRPMRPDAARRLELGAAAVDTRMHPLTRPRAAQAVEDLRHRVQERGERAPAVMATVAAEMTLAGEPADPTAELAGRALADMRPVARTWPLAEEWAATCLAEVLIERGELAEAERLLDVPPAGPAALLARGRLRLAQGRLDDAVEDLRECGRRALALDIVNPALLPWRSALAHALRERGQVREAERVAAEELELARRFGAPRAIGIALVAAAGDDVALLREAVDVLEAAPHERARALAALGAALRRAGDDVQARDPLRLAVDLAHRCGATALEERALGELRATGARPRRRFATGAGALTPSERRIAELAAAGRRNREIAEILVVTLATVEYHLRNAYRKLGIASRTELATAL